MNQENIENQIKRARNELCYTGRYVSNPLLASAGEILLNSADTPYKVGNNPYGSNCVASKSVYVGPHNRTR